MRYIGRCTDGVGGAGDGDDVGIAESGGDAGTGDGGAGTEDGVGVVVAVVVGAGGVGDGDVGGGGGGWRRLVMRPPQQLLRPNVVDDGAIGEDVAGGEGVVALWCDGVASEAGRRSRFARS